MAKGSGKFKTAAPWPVEAGEEPGGALAAPGAAHPEFQDKITITLAEYDSLKAKAAELDHALAREAQRPEPIPVEKPKERKFRCKLCGEKFTSMEKRPNCPLRCSYSWERRTPHGDFVTTEVVPE